MVGYLSPEGDFIEKQNKNDEELLGIGYIAFKERAVYMRKLRKNHGKVELTIKQLVWISEHRERLNIHQRIDLNRLIGECTYG